MGSPRIQNSSRRFLQILSFLIGLLFLVSCTARPDWADKNDRLVREGNISGRTRNDIPKSRVVPSLKPAVVTTLQSLAQVEFAPGVSARLYWGRGNLVAWLTLAPGAEMARETLSAERIMLVCRGSVEQLLGDGFATMRAVPREAPDGTHGGTPRNDFVYLEAGAASALKAGPEGAEVVEVYWPPRADYLTKAGAKNVPARMPEADFPLRPTVAPGVVRNLHDIQLTELAPGAYSRLIAGRGAQLSWLSMFPGVTFTTHFHPEEQLMIVLRGSIVEFTLIDEKVSLNKDDVLLLPGLMIHGGRVGEAGCDVLDIFWPPRPDYHENMVQRHDAFHAIIPEKAEVELVVDGAVRGPGLTFAEGPKWLDGKLYFSNMFFDQGWAGDPRRSAVVEMAPDGTYRYIVYGIMQSNGLMPLSNGHFAVCDMFGHRIVEMTPRGRIVRTLADRFDGRPLDGPDDLVADAKGGIYFTDPQFTPDAAKHQPGPAVYYLTPGRDVIRVIEPNAFANPNGVLLSPDGRTLYVNNTLDNESALNIDSDKDNFLWAYQVNDDGTVSNGRRFAELFVPPEVLERRGRSTGADGMTIDEKGNIYVATYMGLQIFSPSGAFIGIVNFPVFPVSVCFGGDDMKTLYVTCYNRIYKIRTNVQGFAYPPRPPAQTE